MAALIALAFSISLFFHNDHDIHHFPVLLLICLAGIMAAARKQIAIPFSAPALCLLLLWCLSAVTFTMSTVPFTSQIAFCVFSSLPLTFFIVSISEDKEASNAERTLLYCAVPIFIALAFCALYQTLFIPYGLYNRRASFPLLDPNTLATLLNVGLLTVTGAALQTAPPKNRKILIFLSFLLFAALLCTGSRGGLIAAGAGLAVLFGWRKAAPDWKYLTGMAIALLTVASALIAFSGNPASTSDRLSLWRSAWKMMLAHPWAGTGPGTFPLYYPAMREPVDQSLGYFAHNDPLQMGVEMGIAAPLLFYLLLLAVLLRTVHALKAADAALRLRILIPFVALLAIVIQAHVNFPLYMMPVLIACGVLLALWHRATVDALGSGIIHITLRPHLKHAVMLSCVTAGLLLLLYLSGSAAAGNYFMRCAMAARTPEESLIALGWASRFGPDSFIDPEIDMARTNLHLIDRTGSIKSPHLKAQLLGETDRLLKTAAAANPAWAEIDYLRGETAQIRGSKAAMLDSWFAAIRKNPQHFTARRDLTEALMRDSRKEDAVKIVTDGLNYPHPLSYRRWAATFLKEAATP